MVGARRRAGRSRKGAAGEVEDARQQEHEAASRDGGCGQSQGMHLMSNRAPGCPGHNATAHDTRVRMACTAGMPGAEPMPSYGRGTRPPVHSAPPARPPPAGLQVCSRHLRLQIRPTHSCQQRLLRPRPRPRPSTRKLLLCALPGLHYHQRHGAGRGGGGAGAGRVPRGMLPRLPRPRAAGQLQPVALLPAGGRLPAGGGRRECHGSGAWGGGV